MLFEYDSASPESILSYAKKLEGHTFYEILIRYMSYYNRLNELNNDYVTNSKANVNMTKQYIDHLPNAIDELSQEFFSHQEKEHPFVTVK